KDHPPDLWNVLKCGNIHALQKRLHRESLCLARNVPDMRQEGIKGLLKARRSYDPHILWRPRLPPTRQLPEVLGPLGEQDPPKMRSFLHKGHQLPPPDLQIRTVLQPIHLTPG